VDVINNVAESTTQKCKVQELTFSKSIKDYEGLVSRFYEEHPTDLDVPIPWLLQAFSDSENKTPDKIHQAWSQGHSHP
jgi:hypothetical protein